MQMIKYGLLFLIFITSSIIGKLLSRKYKNRVEELEEIKNAFNILKSKIKFSYEPIPEIFEEITQNTKQNVGQIFQIAKQKMEDNPAGTAWEEAVEISENNLKEEDKQVLKSLSKLLGITDTEGQISQIEVTESFLENQLKKAREEKQKNEKLYQKLGTTIGLVIVILLI